jgi:hypothetical protein
MASDKQLFRRQLNEQYRVTLEELAKAEAALERTRQRAQQSIESDEKRVESKRRAVEIFREFASLRGLALEEPHSDKEGAAKQVALRLRGWPRETLLVMRAIHPKRVLVPDLSQSLQEKGLGQIPNHKALSKIFQRLRNRGLVELADHGWGLTSLGDSVSKHLVKEASQSFSSAPADVDRAPKV